MKSVAEAAAELDHKLSQRFIELDEGGYFIIYLDPEANQICAKHYTNFINEKGLACDPETGKPIPTKGKVVREPSRIYRGRTAKELCIELFEKGECPITRLEHAAYLGRELVRAEIALLSGQEYIQD